MLFWDSSAVLPLIFREEYTDAALAAWEVGGPHLAWDWMEVETHAAVVRRNGSAEHWQTWHHCLAGFSLLELPPQANPKIMTWNERWRLRSADAGHVFMFCEMRREFPEIKLVSFDTEMTALAIHESWPLFSSN